MLAMNLNAPRRLSLSTLAEEPNNPFLLEIPLMSTPFGESECTFLPWTEKPMNAPSVIPSKASSCAAVRDSVVRDSVIVHGEEWPQMDCLNEESSQLPTSLEESTSTHSVEVKSEIEPAAVSHNATMDQFEDTVSIRQENVEIPAPLGTKRKTSDSPDPDSDSAQTSKKAKSPVGEAKLQEVAREGQKHWGHKVQSMRQEWADLCMWQKNPHFATQISMCARLHIKSQHECILRQLQLAAVDGVIRPSVFTNDETQSFMGWTGFEIVQCRAKEFRKRIEGMFQSPPNHKTLNNTMRRAGLVPEYCWGEAWSGVGRFVYDKDKRANYSSRG